MLLASLLLLLQAEAVGRLESEYLEVREAARLELLAMGAKALPALRSAGTIEARGVVERIYAAAERAFREANAGPPKGCGETRFMEPAESARWTRELEPLFPGCRLRAAYTSCAHRNMCDHGWLWIYGIAEDDAEVFLIRRGSRLGDALLRRLAPVPGREKETARTLGGGRATDTPVFDEKGRLIRIRPRGP